MRRGDVKRKRRSERMKREDEKKNEMILTVRRGTEVSKRGAVRGSAFGGSEIELTWFGNTINFGAK
jgi:hypothetical protein